MTDGAPPLNFNKDDKLFTYLIDDVS
jgi:hypothetical protein